MKNNTSYLYIVLALLLCVSYTPSLFARRPASPAYRAIKGISDILMPLPLRYSTVQEGENVRAQMYKIMNTLLRRGDCFIILTPDGEATILEYINPREMVFHSKGNLAPDILLDELQKRFPRVWVLLFDERAGRHAQPASGYAGPLKNYFFRMPLPLPLYVSGEIISDSQTNRWQNEVRMLSTIIDFPDLATPELYRQLGIAHRSLGNIDTSLDVFSKGVGLFPNDYQLQRALGATYYFYVKPPQREKSIEYNRTATRLHKQVTGTPFFEAMFNMAMAYADMDELLKARIIYQDILDSLTDFPDPLWESRTRRYLSNVLLKEGTTNRAIVELELELETKAQPPGYTYRRLLDLYSSQNRQNDFYRTLETYYNEFGHEDSEAVKRYTTFMWEYGSDSNIVAATVSTRKLIQANETLLNDVKKDTEWWKKYLEKLESVQATKPTLQKAPQDKE